MTDAGGADKKNGSRYFEVHQSRKFCAVVNPQYP
jgi:hypothetical protein